MNQKRNSGFTLIELLAVIVILAIIALIAVPVIMNIINKANESAFKDSAYGVISAGELYFAERQLEPNGMLEDITIQLPDTTKTLQLKGEVPTGSILITKEGKVAIAVHNNRYCVTKGIDDKDVTVTEDVANCNLPSGEVNPEEGGGNTPQTGSIKTLATTSTEITSIPACLNDGAECTPGTPVAIQVNETDVYNFYVLSESENEITLIMDENLGNKIAWTSEESYGCGVSGDECSKNNIGPITSLNYLNSQTSIWTNIPAISNYKYDNNLNGTTNKTGYQKIEIINGIAKLTSQDAATTTEVSGTSRARILTEEEAIYLQNLNNGTMPSWLYTNLSASSTAEMATGYWLLTSHPTGSYCARRMSYDGGLNVLSYVYYANYLGVRPVITLSK